MRSAECKGVFCACPDCRRDQFAAAALQGLLAANEVASVRVLANDAVKYADALLAALDGTEEK